MHIFYYSSFVGYVVTLEMKESYQQLETSTIELTKIRSHKNEGSSLSINEELTSTVKN